MKNTVLMLLSCSLLSVLSASSQTKTNLHLLHTYPIEGGGKWDYLLADSSSDKLYVSHGTSVNVLNKKTGASLGLIPNTLGAHGIVLVKSLDKGYISNGKTGDVTVFNSATDKEIERIKTGENPDAMLYDDYSKKLFVFNGKSADATVIDPLTDKVIATIPLGGKPETGVSDGKGVIFVNIEDKNEVVCFSANNYKVLKRYPLKTGEEPSGLAIDRNTSRLFIGCANKVMLVMDLRSGKIITEVPIGDGSDGIAFDPVLNQIYSSNGEGTVTVIKASAKDQYQVSQILKTIPGARTISLDSKTHHIFLSVGDKSLEPGTFRVLEYGM